MWRHLLKLFLFLSVSFAAAEGFGGNQSIETLYDKVLKKNYAQIAPLKAYAQKRQTAYMISGALALLVFALFVKYFKATGALVALLMIAGGIYYLKNQTPAISLYKDRFAAYILSPISLNCCGYHYEKGAITQQEVEASKIFAPRIKTYKADKGIFAKEGVRFGYVDIEFDTKENASVERFAQNVFSGIVIEIDRKNPHEGALVSEMLKQRVADVDPEFSAFFADMKRSGKRDGFELYGEVGQQIVDKCYPLAEREIAISFQPDKTYLFVFMKQNPFDPSVYAQFDLKSARGYEAAFREIDKIVEQCK